MAKRATVMAGGVSVVQAALDDVRKSKAQMTRKEFVTKLLAISTQEYETFMHALAVWEMKAAPTVEELKRLKS